MLIRWIPSWLVPLLGLCLLAPFSAWAAVDAGGSEASAAVEPSGGLTQLALSELDPAGLAIARYILRREVAVVAPPEAVIPFAYPDRPTIDCWVGGRWLPLLFNTGTNTSILWSANGWPAACGLHATAFSPWLARLEGKLSGDGAGQTLDYARAVLVDAGAVSLYNVPFRVYHGGDGPPRDFAGALAPLALRHYLIEVDNSNEQIVLHGRDAWLPPADARVLPLLSLPRGIFMPLWLGPEEGGAAMELYWFHLDTGFSGTVGVDPALRESHPDWFAAAEGAAQSFTGWHEQFSYPPLIIRRLELRPLPLFGQTSPEPLAFTGEEGLCYRAAYAELAGYQVGGIIGSGFLQRFNYVLDYELARIYVLP